jgi:hypothetical protein
MGLLAVSEEKEQELLEGQQQHYYGDSGEQFVEDESSAYSYRDGFYRNEWDLDGDQ